MEAKQTITPWKSNPWYWSYHGKPVYLAGGSDDDNLFQWSGEKLTNHLDLLISSGGNYVRNTMSDRLDQGFEIYPYAKNNDGKYDLEQWNDEYWNRFEFFLNETAKRDIIVQIEIWDRFDYSRQFWLPHPYNPENNINYSHEASGLASEYPDHPCENKQPFFYSVPTLENNEVLYRYQERFVDRILSYSLKHDHVLYCIDNETSGSPEWSFWWAKHVRKAAEKLGKGVCLTEMWDNWDISAEEHSSTYDYPELFDFVDVSQNTHVSGRLNYDRILEVKRRLSNKPRPINTVKIYGAELNSFGDTDRDAIERFWHHVLGGGASVRFHRPTSGVGLTPMAQSILKSFRLMEEFIPVWDLDINPESLSSKEGTNTACVVNSNSGSFVAFFSTQFSIEINLPKDSTLSTVYWIDILKGERFEANQKVEGATLALRPPTNGSWLALIV